nr:LRR receptor-like serine/threonine-protein kinase GSO2 [Ipomoea batatas]
MLVSAFAQPDKAKNTIRCIERERQALLDFKHGLVDKDGTLSSWGSDECCNWWGVHCNNTGHVTMLDLSTHSVFAYLSGHKVSPSLLELKHLNYLDLSFNDFQSSPIPEFIGSFKRLRVLILMDADFTGTIPPQLGNLTSLRVFDLSSNNFAGPIPDTFGDMTLLENLYLDFNSFTDGIPKSFWNLTHLRILSMRGNHLNESIAELFQGLLKDSGKSLQILDIDWGEFTGELPADINTRFTSLRELRAHDNQLNGSNFRLPSSLEYLDLSGNEITGQNPDLSHALSALSLRELHLSGNQIIGQIPDLSHALSLEVIDLSQNQLQGGLPETIGNLSKLTELYASSNSLEGVVTEAHFSNLTELQELDLSYNAALSFNMSSNWVPLHLYLLLLANCKIGPQFPKWLHTKNEIGILDISSSDISDIIPNSFWNFSKGYSYLNLSYNKIDGRLPYLQNESSFRAIDLSSNNFWGPIPIFINSNPISVLHLSNNKFVGSISFLCSIRSTISIDLSYNQLSGEIPHCWNKSFVDDLHVLNLANNRFSGKVPNSLGSLLELESLHLRNNNLTGELPSSLQNCTSLCC